MKKKYLKRGISLIVLVITIIVIIILAGAVILSLSQNNPISSATEASFKSNAQTYNSELSIAVATKYVLDFAFNPKTLYATKWDGTTGNIPGSVKQYITSMTAKDGDKYIIQQGKLIYVGIDTNEKQFAKTLGLSDPYVKNGLVLWLDAADFKNNPATNTWVDRSGNNNNGTANFFNYNETSGNDGKGAVIFDGVDDTVELPLLPAQTNQSLSFFVWIYWKGISNGLVSGIWGHYGIANNNSHFEIEPTGMRIRMGDIQKNVMIAPPINTWVQVGFVYDQTAVKYYINGVEVDSFLGSTGTILGQGRHIIGTSDNTRYFNGLISSALLYNRALTNAEILYNYASGY
jgi:hypothetical protein